MSAGEAFQTPEARRTTTRHIFAITVLHKEGSPVSDDEMDKAILQDLRKYGYVTMKRYLPVKDEFRTIT